MGKFIDGLVSFAEQSGEPKSVTLLGIDGTVVMLPIEEVIVPPAHDTEEPSVLISAEDTPPRGGDDYVL